MSINEGDVVSGGRIDDSAGDKNAAQVTAGPELPLQENRCGAGAFWRSGYFGNESPLDVKIMRYARLVTDGAGFRVKRYLVDDDKYPVTAPLILEQSAGPQTTNTTERFSTNKKCRRMSIEIRFPDADEARSVLRLQNTFIPVGTR